MQLYALRICGILTHAVVVARVMTDINSHIYIVQRFLQFYFALWQDFERFRDNSHHDSTVTYNPVSSMQSME